jgi:hypothetical protein
MRAIAPVIVFTSSMLFAQERISDLKWQYRILVVSGADGKTIELLESGEEGLEDRDLKVFILSGKGMREYAAKPPLAKELLQRLDPPEGKPMAYLIGKDGKTTLSWTLGDFTLEKLFASIDAMPMRKKEVRERR